MANEKRLIDANALKDGLMKLEASGGHKYYRKGMDDTLHFHMPHIIDDAPTVDAVEADEMREFASDVAYQFGYYCQHKGRLHITHGGLSTLEWAFDILGWENPHPVPECECEIDGCHEHGTCGANTADGYKRMCGKHCLERRTDG